MPRISVRGHASSALSGPLVGDFRIAAPLIGQRPAATSLFWSLEERHDRPGRMEVRQPLTLSNLA
jgi:hypothetical protein